MPPRKPTAGAESPTSSETTDDREKSDPTTRAAEDPAVDRGERIETGKAIARGGKSSGRVEGAEEDASQDEDR